MRKYEGLFIFPPEETSDAAKEGEKRLEEAIRRFGGNVLERRDWGRRALGYPIRKAREGRMLLWNFEMESSQVAEFRKILQLDEKILKTTIVKPLVPKPVKESKKKSKRPHGAPQPREGKEEVRARQSE